MRPWVAERPRAQMASRAHRSWRSTPTRCCSPSAGERSLIGTHLQFVDADLRADWVSKLPSPGPYDAAVSTTALHWLGLEQLVRLYPIAGRGAPPGRGLPRRRPARFRPRPAGHRGRRPPGPTGMAGRAGGRGGLRRMVGSGCRGTGSRRRGRRARGSGGRTIRTRTRRTATNSIGLRSTRRASSRSERSGSTWPTASWWRSGETASLVVCCGRSILSGARYCRSAERRRPCRGVMRAGNKRAERLGRVHRPS